MTLFNTVRFGAPNTANAPTPAVRFAPKALPGPTADSVRFSGQTPDSRELKRFLNLMEKRGKWYVGSIALETMQRRAAKRLDTLPKEERTEAFYAAMATGKESVQRAAAHALPKEERTEAFYAAMATSKESVQSAVATHIGFLPEEERIRAFYAAMATGRESVQEAAASQIDVLPEKDRLVAFQAAMGTGTESVQRAAAFLSAWLPEEALTEALYAVKGTGRESVQEAAVLFLPLSTLEKHLSFRQEE